MNDLSRAIILRQSNNRICTVFGLALFGIALMFAASVVMAAATTTKDEAAKSQSSEDVLKWLQMTGTKSASDAKDEKEQKLAKEAKDAAAKSASSTSARALPVQVEKTHVQATPTAPNLTDSRPGPDPLMMVAAVPSSMMAMPPDANPSVAAIASPASATAPAAQPDELEVKVLSRAQPVFPAEAQDKGFAKGKVTARLYVGTDGAVTRVEIIEASPKRIFDRAVTSAAMRWKFSPIPAPNATDVTFNFKLDDTP